MNKLEEIIELENKQEELSSYRFKLYYEDNDRPSREYNIALKQEQDIAKKIYNLMSHVKKEYRLQDDVFKDFIKKNPYLDGIVHKDGYGTRLSFEIKLNKNIPAPYLKFQFDKDFTTSLYDVDDDDDKYKKLYMQYLDSIFDPYVSNWSIRGLENSSWRSTERDFRFYKYFYKYQRFIGKDTYGRTPYCWYENDSKNEKKNKDKE